MSDVVVKKSDNKLRLVRLRTTMDELNYLDRVIRELMAPLRERKLTASQTIQELLIDEGIDPTLMAQIEGLEVDDDALEIRYKLKEVTTPPPTPDKTTPPKKKAASKKKAAKAGSRKR